MALLRTGQHWLQGGTVTEPGRGWEMKKRSGWTKECKRLVTGIFIGLLTGFILLNAGAGIYAHQIRTDYKELLGTIFGNIKAVYPDVPEEQLIQVLYRRGNENTGRDILARYGIYGEYGQESFEMLEIQIRNFRLFLNVLLLLFFLVLTVLLLLYQRKRQTGITKLQCYLEALHKEGYGLALKDNGEDELSVLRNEIYKLTIMLKEQACRSDAQKRALADSVADISHQLKTPLTSMTVLMDNLSEDRDMDPLTRQHFISEVTYQLTGMSWLVTTMLKLSRLDAGVVELERERIEISVLVAEAIQKVEVTAEWNDISFLLDIPSEAGVYADKRWTAEALANIIKNAVEHSPRGADVRIQAEENDVYSQIVIRDYGEGMTEEQQKKMFCRFYRGASVREDSVGIGLALAREIIEKQDGYVSVHSAMGKGTSIIIKFIG